MGRVAVQAGPLLPVPQPGATAADAAVRVNVTLSPAVSRGTAAPLFVFVRQQARAGHRWPPSACEPVSPRQ